MNEPVKPLLAAWGNYYVIIGSSGAALIGLQFVVVTLVATLRRQPRADALNAFGTPTVVNFVGALVIALVMSAPWPTLFPLSVALAAYGAFGVAYSLLVVRRARRQTDYQPVWEDWLWYALLPCASYGGLVLAAAGL